MYLCISIFDLHQMNKNDYSKGVVYINGNFFLKNLRAFMYLSSILVSAVKATAFGTAIAIVGCYKGFSVSSADGAEGVGRATTGSAVTAIMIILIIDFFLNHLLYAVLNFK